MPTEHLTMEENLMCSCVCVAAVCCGFTYMAEAGTVIGLTLHPAMETQAR